MHQSIDAGDAVSKRYLTVDAEGISFCESSVSNEVRRFPYRQIQSILLAPNGLLCIQAGTQVFKIPTQATDVAHQLLIARLVNQVRKTMDTAPVP